MLVKRLPLLFFAAFVMLSFPSSATNDPSFVKTKEGIIIYPTQASIANVKAVRLEVVTDHIIRVSASADKTIPDRKSLITVYTPAATQWNIIQGKESVSLKTGSLVAIVSLKTGAVSFTDTKGNRILSEKESDSRSLKPTVIDGTPLYSIRQSFQTAADEGYYGLGQHQDDVFNYKGEQVSFFQNNTEVAIPFLISSKAYGILWDNYSLTKAGDIRPYRPLSALKLFSKDGDQGWLTATYYNNKVDTSKAILVKAESAINYEFLGDSKLYLPAEFTPASGKVVWEGSISSDFTGVHKLRFMYGGYIKVWINGKLELDRWRKAWNPAPALLNLNFKKGEKYPVKIEWIPEGTESYLSFKWLEPLSPSEQNTFSFLSDAGSLLDYYFVQGATMDDVISGYRVLTGKAPIVPRWAMGFWQSRERYKTEDEILTTVDEFRKRKIPIDNIVLDWSYWKEAEWGSQEFDPARFPSPDSMTAVLHKKYNTHLMISVWPKFYEGIEAYKEFDKNGWLYKRNIADRQRDWIAKGYTSTFYDAFNPEARKGFWNLINKKIWSKGVDAWWMDASEPDILSNVSPQKRIEQMTPTALGPAAEYLNAYPLQNAKGIYEGQRATSPDKRVFLLTRSGFAGSQRYGAAIWSGDIGARWQDMKAQISAGINFSMSGVPYWTMDVGGFIVENRFEHPNEKDQEEWREQMTRWYQFGAFVPLFRVHGQFPYREIYNTAPENHPAYQSMLYYDKLRYRLLPYLYSLAGSAYHSNTILMRGLTMDYGKDKNVLSIGDQYLFGPSLLINPVYTYKATSRNVYLPASTGWYNLYTGAYEKGGKNIKADAPYERMPVFVKQGAIIPFGPELQYTDEKPADEITLYIYTGRDGAFTFYEDEGINYNYEKGLYAAIPIVYNDKTKTVTIGDRKGTFPGMLQKRKFSVIWITPDEPKSLDFDQQPDNEILYSGKKVSLSKKK